MNLDNSTNHIRVIARPLKNNVHTDYIKQVPERDLHNIEKENSKPDLFMKPVVDPVVRTT